MTRTPLRAALPCLLAAVLLAAATAEGAEQRRVADGRCVEALAPAGGPAGGIAVPGPAAAALVRLCDGAWLRLAAEGAALVLLPLEVPAGQDPASAGLDDPHRLPDGEVTFGRGAIAAAWLTGPTEIYGHGILGDGIEASGLALSRRDGGRAAFALPGDSVFEDLRVRLVDLDGDALEELVVIRSYLDRGAALAVYALGAAGIEARAESPAIGQSHRWLNPAGVADFDGDGALEIAIVETPHIGGILRVYQLTPAGLVLEASRPGFSNHAIGSRVLDMAAVVDWNGDGIADLALPDAGRRRMTVVTFAGGALELLATLRKGAAVTTAVLATDLDGDGRPELLYGLADGSLMLASP